MRPNLSPSKIHRRAGGRRRYNAQRRRARDKRRAQVKAALLATECPCMIDYGWAAQLARELGIHHSQVSRDLAAIRPVLVLPDPCCRIHAARRVREAEIAEIRARYPSFDDRVREILERQ